MFQSTGIPLIDPAVHVSTHFTLGEFAATSHSDLYLENLKFCSDNLDALKLVGAQLDIIRDFYGGPVTISSGGRCPALNQAVGGSPSSQHMRGQAADIEVQGISYADVFQDIKAGHIKGLSLHQVIEEHANAKVWVHIGINVAGMKLPTDYMVYNGEKYIHVG